jgi:hypothetical protein
LVEGKMQKALVQVMQGKISCEENHQGVINLQQSPDPCAESREKYQCLTSL